MTELNCYEIEDVNGGILPLALGVVTVGKALGAGFAIGTAVGAIIALTKVR